MEAGISTGLTAKEGRKFGLTVGIAFGVFAAIAWWRGHSTSWMVLAALAGVLIVAGIVIPTMLGPVQSAWMAFARVLSRFTTPIFMSIVYFLVITPIALVMRAFGRQPMKHPETNGGFWVDANSGGRSDMEHQF